MKARTPSQLGRFKREKGVRWEREAAKLFAAWLGSECRRTPLSGAYGSGWNLGGDLMFQELLPLYIELKNDESWRLEHLFTGTGPIFKWWEKAAGEARMNHQVPLLVFKRNHIEPMVMYQGDSWQCRANTPPATTSLFLTAERRSVMMLGEFLPRHRPPSPRHPKNQEVLF